MDIELQSEIAKLEEAIWAVEARIDSELDKATRSWWVADLARCDQDLAELRTYCC